MNVLITGAAGGLGRAMAVECGKRGYDLFLTDMYEAALRRVQTGLERRFGVTAAVKACDLTKPESVDELVTKVVEDSGSTLSGIDSVTSQSSENLSMVMFTYEYGVDIDECYADLRTAP